MIHQNSNTNQRENVKQNECLKGFLIGILVLKF